MYMPNFSFVTQFGEELCEEYPQNKKNLLKKYILRLQGAAMGLKTQNNQTANL